MLLDFTPKGVTHTITARFTPARLPDTKKPYRLKPALQSRPDLREAASKGEVYNIAADPKVIEEGFLAFCEPACCLTAIPLTRPCAAWACACPARLAGRGRAW